MAIQPAAAPLRARIRPPGSKSLTNRALVCAALADGESTLRHALDSDDTRVMIDALRQLGIAVASREAGTTLAVTGCGGRIPAGQAELYVAGSGTTMRFLTAMVTLGHGQFRLYGEPRMHERPIDDLLSALRSLGADVRCDEATRCPPVAISATGLEGGTTTVRSDISSQFLSGLLMAAPFARRKVVVRVAGALVSEPYVEMTMSVMARFGVTVDRESDPFAYCVAGGQRYVAQDYPIEPDATAASYFFAAAAITRGSVTVEGLSRSSIQGDIAFCELLERMGCAVHYGTDEITVIGGPLSGIHADMNKISDTVQTLAAVALFAAGPTTITGVGHIRHKETDRIGNLAKELEKLGASVEEHADGMTITSSSLHGSTVETYNDHRMAMSLSLVGLRVAGVVIRDPNCTRKTYPGFFHDLAQLTAGARD